MKLHRKKLPPALKHAAYSTTTLLPGEDPAEFDKLRQELIAEFVPTGRFEENTVATMARYVWRKENLLSIRIANAARKRYAAIRTEASPNEYFAMTDAGWVPDTEGYKKAIEEMDDRARKELGDAFSFIEMDGELSYSELMEALDIEDRLDAMIGRCVKTLLHVRGVKSLYASPAAPAQSPARFSRSDAA